MRWPLRRVLVQGPSMVPTLRHGDTLLVWMAAARPRVGEVVLVESPSAGLVVKRVAALRSDGSVWIEGDNPFGSTDSRQFGAVAADAVRGRALMRLWPPRLVRVRPASPITPKD